MAQRCGKMRTNGKPCRHFVDQQGLCPIHDKRQTQAHRAVTFFWFFVCTLFAIVIFHLNRSEPNKDLSPWQQDIERALTQFAEHPDAAIAALENIIRSTERSEGVSADQRAMLWQMLGEQHLRRWHVFYAINAFTQAQALAYNPQREQRLESLKQHFAQMQTERKQKRPYNAHRQSGVAPALQGDIIVANVYLDLPDKAWSNKSLLLAKQAQKTMDQWLNAQTQRYYPAPFNIQHRHFSGRAQNRVGFETVRRPSDVLSRVTAPMPYGSVSEMISALHKEQLDAAIAVLLHYPHESRAFAFPCRGTPWVDKKHRCMEEFAVITHEITHNNWPTVAVTQTHETLHLFGADDLYVVGGAQTYDTTDIMHYSFPRLADSHLKPLTAWAIGWQKEKPETPFTVEEQ